MYIIKDWADNLVFDEKFHVAVLQQMSDHPLVAVALKTLDLTFSRWYA